MKKIDSFFGTPVILSIATEQQPIPMLASLGVPIAGGGWAPSNVFLLYYINLVINGEEIIFWLTSVLCMIK